MKKIFSKIKKFISKEFIMYTALFFFIMVALYAMAIFAGMASAPKFTYAEF